MSQQFGRSKRTNSALPISSKHLQRRWVEHVQDLHNRRLEEIRQKNIRPNSTGNQWGQRDAAGVTDPKKPFYPHLRNNLKRAQLEDERFLHIEWENRVLLMKMSNIMAQAPSPYDSSREFSPGVRLSPNQYPVIDMHVSKETRLPGRAIEPRSLNHAHRRAELQRIARENAAIVSRIQQRQPTYSRDKWVQERRQTEQYLGMITEFPERSRYSPQNRLYSRGGSTISNSSSRPITAPGGYSEARQQQPGALPMLGGSAGAGEMEQLLLDRPAQHGTLALSLALPLSGGRPQLQLGDAIVVEPNSTAREYHLVTSLAWRGNVIVQTGAPLAYDHPEGVLVRKVDPQVAQQLLLQYRQQQGVQGEADEAEAERRAALEAEAEADRARAAEAAAQIEAEGRAAEAASAAAAADADADADADAMAADADGPAAEPSELEDGAGAEGAGSASAPPAAAAAESELPPPPPSDAEGGDGSAAGSGGAEPAAAESAPPPAVLLQPAGAADGAVSDELPSGMSHSEAEETPLPSEAETEMPHSQAGDSPSRSAIAGEPSFLGPPPDGMDALSDGGESGGGAELAAELAAAEADAEAAAQAAEAAESAASQSASDAEAAAR